MEELSFQSFRLNSLKSILSPLSLAPHIQSLSKLVSDTFTIYAESNYLLKHLYCYPGLSHQPVPGFLQ